MTSLKNNFKKLSLVITFLSMSGIFSTASADTVSSPVIGCKTEIHYSTNNDSTLSTGGFGFKINKSSIGKEYPVMTDWILSIVGSADVIIAGHVVPHYAIDLKHRKSNRSYSVYLNPQTKWSGKLEFDLGSEGAKISCLEVEMFGDVTSL